MRNFILEIKKLLLKGIFYQFCCDNFFICHAKDWLLENTGLSILLAILSRQLNVLKLVQLINTASVDGSWPRVIAASIVELSEIRATFSSFPSLTLLQFITFYIT